MAPYAGVGNETFNVIDDDAVIARYGQTDRARRASNVGVNLGAQSDLRVGAYIGRSTASIEVGDPGFPELRGRKRAPRSCWRVDTQDSPVVPVGRMALAGAAVARLQRSRRVVDAETETVEIDSSLTQLSGVANHFWSLGPQQSRVRLRRHSARRSTTTPLPTDQFSLGTPFRLGAYDAGELRGDHYYVATGGYLRRVGRLPDFMGGPVFAGGWLENGDAFDEWAHAALADQRRRRPRDGHASSARSSWPVRGASTDAGAPTSVSAARSAEGSVVPAP